MEMEQTTPSTEVTESTAPVESTPEATTEPTASAESQADTSVPAPPVEAYKPNWKFKAAGLEHEIEEDYRGYVKSAEDEAKIRRLMERAYGGKAAWDENKELKTYKANMDQSFKAFNSLVASNDTYKALQMLGLSNEQVLMAAKQILDIDALPQQAKELYTRQQQQEQELARLYQERQMFESQNQQMAIKQKDFELSQALQDQSIQDVQKQFDTANGVGSFKQLVIAEGQRQWALSGRDLTVKEAVDAVMKTIAPFRQQPTHQPSVVAPKAVPVLPATGSGSKGSPAGGVSVSSLDDLKKIANSL